MTSLINVHFRYRKADRSDPNWIRLQGSDRYGVLTCVIATSRDPKIFARHPRFRKVIGGPKNGYYIENDCPFDNKDVAELRLDQHRNIVRFTDLSGLIPARTRGRDEEVRHMSYCDPWDHATIWRDGNQNLVLTNEPYVVGDFPAWCATRGWRCVLIPKHIGTYLAGETFCFLAAPPKSRADINAIAERLIAGWPR